MLLQSHENFNYVADFDPRSGHITKMHRSEAGDLLLQTLRGHCSRLGEDNAVLYRLDRELRLRLGGRDLPVGQADRVEWTSDGTTSTLEVEFEGEIASVCYPSGPSLEGDPTPFVEPEHFDFGLFIANVAGDAGRSARIYTKD